MTDNNKVIINRFDEDIVNIIKEEANQLLITLREKYNLSIGLTVNNIDPESTTILKIGLSIITDNGIVMNKSANDYINVMELYKLPDLGEFIVVKDEVYKIIGYKKSKNPIILQNIKNLKYKRMKIDILKSYFI